MNWKDIGSQLAGTGLPMLGRLLYGPLGETVGEALGKVIAGTLGTEATPEAVAAAIQANPDAAAAKLSDLEAVKRAEFDAASKSLQSVNETIRQEVSAPTGDKFTRWARPANMWAVAGVTSGYGLCMVASAVALVITKDALPLATLVNLAPVLGVALMPAGAIAGVAAWGRTQEKLAGVADGGNVTTVAGAASKITKKT